ncbi:MAG: WYL domain-containing protein [Lachnospiraceae bacterium]|nr:WYL domain-containing protein [Lachnospiraceae bacterium]
MKDFSNNKVERVLDIYRRLQDGAVLNKTEAANHYGVTERTIQRDIEDVRNYLSGDMEETGYVNEVIYDHRAKGYRLERVYRQALTNAEILAVCKILLDSRAFTKGEMSNLLEKLMICCVPENNRKRVEGLVRNELFHYVEPRHRKEFLDSLWDIGQAIAECRYIEIQYRRNKGQELVTRKLKPLAIMFSEFYFYLTAFIDDKEIREHFDVVNDSFPTIYRIDRIQKLTVLDEHYRIPYKDRFEEGEFRKRIQFMYGGKLQKVKFRYHGENIEAVLDRLPTAEILEEQDGVYTVSAEVFGKGIDMWLRSQGERVEVV